MSLTRKNSIGQKIICDFHSHFQSERHVSEVVNLSDRWLYRVGSISALGFGLAYLIIIILYVPLGAPPSGAEKWLTYMAGHISAWWAILGLSVLTDFLLVPMALALYAALKGINRNGMLLAAAFVGLFVILDLALTWTNYAVLINLSTNYTAATNDMQRAGLVTVASYPASVLDSDLLDVYNTVTLSIGILVVGFVMRKGSFSRRTAYIGLATGILGVVGVVGPVFISALSGTILIASLLTMVWTLLVGYDLYRLGQRTA